MSPHPRRTRKTAIMLALGAPLACGDTGGDTGLTVASATNATSATTSTSSTTSVDPGSSGPGSPGSATTIEGTTSATTGGAATSSTATSSTTTNSATSDAGSTGGPPVTLCEPAGNLIEHGSLDEGLGGDAPVGWEVRSPGQQDLCADSGPHLFASAPAPGCAGGAVTIDAGDVWDCYAVQTVSPYNSIEGGATYIVRAAVRSQGNAVNPSAWFVLGAQWLDANDSFFGDEKNPKTPDAAANDYDWKVLEWELVAPANARRILVWMTAHYPGQVEYDHVAVLKKP